MIEDKYVYIYGRHAVEEAVRERPDVVGTVYLSDDAELRALAVGAGIEVTALDEARLPGGIPKTATHQGCVAAIDHAKLTLAYKKFRETLSSTPDTALLVLGEVQDPHNVGAVIRSAAAFGLAGVLVPPHRQAPINGTVIKVSSGMAFRIPLVAISNVNATLRDLKDRGFWVYGLEGESEHILTKETFSRPSVFVLGNEAKGLRAKTREVCDTLLSIPMHPRAESLNAAASTAATLYAWSAQHPAALKGSQAPR